MTRAYSHDRPHVWHFKEMTCLLSAHLQPTKGAHNEDKLNRNDPYQSTVPLLSRVPIKIRVRLSLVISELPMDSLSLDDPATP